MEVTTMSKNEQQIYTHALAVLYGKLSIREFSILSGKSYRQSQRVIRKIREKGLLGAKHGNRGKTPWNKIELRTKNYVMDLFERYFSDFNLTHFRERLKEEYGITIKRETLRKWAKEKDLIKRPKRRPRKVHCLRPRMPQEGMLVQFDGSEHAWFGSNKSIYTLIGGIDDATGEVLYLEFFPGEDTFNCMKAMRGIIERKGIPEAFYLDRAGHFGKPYCEQNRTQIGRALEELGCKVILANSPQAKGRIERLWGTLQDRLVAELRYNSITTVRKANEYLHKTFINKFNKQFTVTARSKDSSYSEIKSWMNINRIFCIKEKRRISSGNAFSFENEKYQVNYGEDMRYRYITILIYEDGKLEFELMGKFVSVSKIEKVDKILLIDQKAA